MMNEVILIGRLTADPELRYTNSGKAVANFTLAVNRYSGKEADFIRIVAWEKIAENTANYQVKGNKLAVKGRLQIRSYEDRDGVKRTIAEVVASNVVFLDSKKDTKGPPGEYEPGGFSDDDVPF